ncbi:MAG: tetratricopeptide repeat protein, partial [Acidobacteriota bacterium]
YASPEQFLGQPITVASDVYQLGLLLYRLLSGRLPYDIRTGGAAEARRLICEVPPPKPSAALREMSRADTESVTGGAFPIMDLEDLQDWARDLRGDLDNIAAKALAKAPGERYASVDALIADVERYLSGQPVSARRPTLAYVTGKFIARNRLAVAAVVGVVALVAGLITAYTLELRQERDRAESALIAVEQSRGEAESLSRSLVELFALADPERTPGSPDGALDLLELSAERVRAGIDEQPMASARLLHVIGEIYTKRDHPEKAADLAREVLDIRRTRLPANHPEIAHSANELGMIYGRLQRFDEADVLLQEALSIREAGDDDELEALTLNNLGNLRWRQGLLTDAEAFHRRALALRESLPEPDPVRIGDSANNLGVLLNALSRPKEAVPFFERALEAHAESYGEDHATTAVARNNLGIAALGLWRWTAAEGHFNRAAEAWRRAYGADHSRTLRAEFNAAQAIRWRGQPEASVEILRSVLERQERAEPPMTEEIGRTLSTLGAVLTDLGDFQSATEAVSRSVALQLELFGAEHRRTLISRYSRARLWR